MKKLIFVLALVAIAVVTSVAPEKTYARGVCSGCTACSGGWKYCAVQVGGTCFAEKVACD